MLNFSTYGNFWDTLYRIHILISRDTSFRNYVTVKVIHSSGSVLTSIGSYVFNFVESLVCLTRLIFFCLVLLTISIFLCLVFLTTRIFFCLVFLTRTIFFCLVSLTTLIFFYLASLTRLVLFCFLY